MPIWRIGMETVLLIWSGEEYGGVHWYPNLGTTEQPEFGENSLDR